MKKLLPASAVAFGVFVAWPELDTEAKGLLVGGALLVAFVASKVRGWR